MCPSVTPRPAGAHLRPLTSPQPGSRGRVTVWGHHRGRAHGQTLPHHPTTGKPPTPAPRAAPWTRTGTGTAHPRPARPQEIEVSLSPAYLRPPLRSPRPRRLQPYKAGAEPHAPRPPCVHRKSRSTLPLLTVNTSAAPARPWPPRYRGQAHPVPLRPRWGPPWSPRCPPRPCHPAE